MTRTPLTLEQCFQILDRVNDPELDYLRHIYLSKLNGEERLKRVLPQLRRKARGYLRRYPDSFSNPSA